VTRRSREPSMTQGARYSFIFLFVLMVALTSGSYVLSARAVHQATASAASTLQLCEAGNESRAQQVTLWTHLVAISQPPPHQSAAAEGRQQATVAVFLAYVHHVFAPRNCHAEPKGQNP
jgi:hypothetical protein